MSIYEGGKTTARGWRSRKIYLSDEAHQLLSDHCRNTPLTISAWIDMAIKRELDSPAARFLREQQPVAEARAEQIPHAVGERVPQRRVRIEDEKPVTSKKDFKVDL